MDICNNAYNLLVRFYGDTYERLPPMIRRIKHPVVSAITEAARSKLFLQQVASDGLRLWGENHRAIALFRSTAIRPS